MTIPLADCPLSDKAGFLKLKIALYHPIASLHHWVLAYVSIFGSVLTVRANAPDRTERTICLLGSKAAMRSSESISLCLANGKTIFFCVNSACEDIDSWLAAFVLGASRTYHSSYITEADIGFGAFGDVYSAVCKKTGVTFAVKEIDRQPEVDEMTRRSAVDIEREVFLCKSLVLPGIVQTREVFVTLNKVYIVMEYFPSGTLAAFVKDKGGQLSELDAKPIMAKLLEAVSKLHYLGVAHRDIKPENILVRLTESERVKDIALCDFGLARLARPGDNVMRSTVGTVKYMAPEVLRGQRYGLGVDLFALGVLLYSIISREFPFSNSALSLAGSGVEIEGNSAPTMKFTSERWENVSQDCLCFIRAMLHEDPEKRLTAEQALQHPWIRPVLSQENHGITRGVSFSSDHTSVASPGDLTEKSFNSETESIDLGESQNDEGPGAVAFDGINILELGDKGLSVAIGPQADSKVRKGSHSTIEDLPDNLQRDLFSLSASESSVSDETSYSTAGATFEDSRRKSQKIAAIANNFQQNGNDRLFNALGEDQSTLSCEEELGLFKISRWSRKSKKIEKDGMSKQGHVKGALSRLASAMCRCFAVSKVSHLESASASFTTRD